MFPTTDNSQTIIDALLDAAEHTGVLVLTQHKTVSVQRQNDNGFIVSYKGKGDELQNEMYDSVILATGSAPGGYQLAADLGLDIVKPVPSLFTLSAKTQVKEGGLLYGLSGLSVPSARITFKFQGTGLSYV